MAAAAATAPLGLGLYLSFSRGALFACVAGLIALIVAARSWDQLQAAALAVAAAVAACIPAAPSRSVTALAGPLGTREREGAIALVVLVAVMLAAGVAQRILAARAGAGRLRLPRRAPLIATLLICAGLAGAIVAGAKETSGQPALSGGATRLVSLQSNRYDYWDVALRAFAASPLHGVGAGGWRVDWLRWRKVNEFAQDAHSLELQTLAELGVVGVALLLACFGGVAVAARRALVSGRAVAGPVAALVVYVSPQPAGLGLADAGGDAGGGRARRLPAGAARHPVGARAGGQSASAIRGASRLNTHTARTQRPMKMAIGTTTCTNPVSTGALGWMTHLRVSSNSGARGLSARRSWSVPRARWSGYSTGVA